MKNNQQMSRISIDVTKEQHRLLKAKAALAGKSLSQLFLESVGIEKISEEELWLFDPKNKKLVESIKESLKQSARGETVDWDDIKHKYDV